MLRLLRHVDAEAVNAVHHYQFHIRHACLGKFGRCKDEIDLPGLRCCKHSIIAQIQRRHLFQLRLLSVIIFVRFHHNLLFLLERDYFPRAAADRRRRISFFICMLRHNAQSCRRIKEDRPRLGECELHLRRGQGAHRLHRGQIHGAGRLLRRFVGKDDILCRQRLTI